MAMVADDQTEVLRALADPTCRQICAVLREGELAAGEIADRSSISGPSISRHLNVLRGAGLVVERREANRILYSLPGDLAPSILFDGEPIHAGPPEPGPSGFSDLKQPSQTHADDGESVLVFDGDCGFCTSAAKWAARAFHHGERAEAWQLLGPDFLDQHHLSLDDVRDAAWWVDGSGDRERGHRAIGRALTAGGGLRRVLGAFVLVPPVSWLAAGVYRVVVRWRYLLPGGTPACKVPTSRPPNV